MARTMLFISISPERSARITVPWTALIYVPAPRPPLNLAGSCRDASMGQGWGTGAPGGRRLCLHTSFLFFHLQSFTMEPNLRTIGTDLLPLGPPAGVEGCGPARSWVRKAVSWSPGCCGDMLTPAGVSMDPGAGATTKKKNPPKNRNKLFFFYCISIQICNVLVVLTSESPFPAESGC